MSTPVSAAGWHETLDSCPHIAMTAYDGARMKLTHCSNRTSDKSLCGRYLFIE